MANVTRQVRAGVVPSHNLVSCSMPARQCLLMDGSNYIITGDAGQVR